MQWGFYVDQTRCTGCFACVVACKDVNDVGAGEASWRKIVAIEKGIFPEVFMSFLPVSCWHCSRPVCVEACPVGAITKRKAGGVVLVDHEACLGGTECGFACQKACPYNVPQFGAETNPKMQKCDLCINRITENKPPVCVAACPTYALEAGPLDELWEKYGDVREAEGFRYSSACKPSVIFKPKRRISGARAETV
jgi:anaerobic dimethyl sulfoxide reductase subunit B (iron-sulfur subunit)